MTMIHKPFTKINYISVHFWDNEFLWIFYLIGKLDSLYLNISISLKNIRSTIIIEPIKGIQGFV